MRVARALTATALFALVAAPSCNAVLGVEKLPGEKPVKYAVAACEQCTEKSCVAAERACEADAACLGPYACLAQCAVDDLRCRSACENAVPGALPESYYAIDGCRRLGCTSECYGSQLFFGYGEGCNSCAASKCGPQLSACVRSAATDKGHVGDCERQVACPQRVDPQNPSVSLDCTNSVSNPTEFGALVSCGYGVSCGECALVIGHDLRCVGAYSWSPATAPHFAFSFGVIDAVKGDPVAGAHVRACRGIACLDCAGPYSEADVDEKGRVTIDVPGGFDGCFEITKPSFAPMLWYYGRPVNHAWGGGVVTLLSYDDLARAAVVLKVPVDDARGHVVVTTFDCTYSRAKGVTLAGKPGDDETRVFYSEGTTPSATATETDGSGLFSIIDVPEGPLDVAVDLGGKRLGHWPVVVRKGAVTQMAIFPSTAGR